MWRLAPLAVLAVALGLPPRAVAGDEPRLVLLLAAAAERASAEPLRTAVEAQLSEFDVAVRIAEVPELPGEFAAQVAAARTAAAGAFSAVWLTRAERELFIFVADERTEKILVEALPGGAAPGSGVGWESTCDAIATVVRSALRPWLAAQIPPLPAPAALAVPAMIAPAIAPTPPAKDAPAKRAAPSDLRAVVSAGYAPSALDLGGGRVAHGAELALGLLVRGRIEIAAAVYALAPLALDARGADLRYAQVPLKLSVAGMLPAGRFDLGCRLGLVVDFSRVVGIPPAEAAEDTAIAAVGFAPSLFARFAAKGWLAVFLDVGADVYGRDREYLWDGEIALRTRRVRPRLSVGLALVAPTAPARR